MLRIKKFSGNTIYDRNGYGYRYYNANKILKIVFIHILILFFIRLMIHEPLREIIMVVYASCVFMECVFFFACYVDGYIVKDTEINYYKAFKKKSIKYKDINSIVVSQAYGKNSVGYLGRYKKNADGKIRFKPYPWITMCGVGVIPDKILNGYDGTLTSLGVDYYLKKNGLIYSLLWNRLLVENLLMQYEGKFYITNSIAVRYRKELNEFSEKYKVGTDRIYIITDVVAVHFMWDNDF